MSTSPARRCAAPLSAAVSALTLRPVLVSGQAPPSAREQLVWHWFGACAGSDSLILEFRVDGKLVYSSAFPICQVRHSDIKPEPQQRLLTFRFDAAPRRFGSQYQASEPEPIIGSVWEASQRRTAIVLRVSFATTERVLLNTRHVARPDTPARSEWIRGLELITRPVPRPGELTFYLIDPRGTRAAGPAAVREIQGSNHQFRTAERVATRLLALVCGTVPALVPGPVMSLVTEDRPE